MIQIRKAFIGLSVVLGSLFANQVMAQQTCTSYQIPNEMKDQDEPPSGVFSGKIAGLSFYDSELVAGPTPLLKHIVSVNFDSVEINKKTYRCLSISVEKLFVTDSAHANRVVDQLQKILTQAMALNLTISGALVEGNPDPKSRWISFGKGFSLVAGQSSELTIKK